MSAKLYAGIDVGTGSARAGVFDEAGKMHGMAAEAIRIWTPAHDFAEQSSDDIWRACGIAVRGALAQAAASPSEVRGVGFDATCSLVALDAADAPVTVSPASKDEQNVILWMDHRAMEQTARVNRGGYDVLKYVGGAISPEMETPKLLWLKEHLPATWKRTAKFFDLPDFLVYRATGIDTRSLCTTTCKWTYLGHEGKWDDAFFHAVGLGDLVEEGYARIGTRVRPMGERVGGITERAAKELGLAAGTPVGVSIIDAHAGGLGMIGLSIDGEEAGARALERRIALIAGTSSCHMALSREARFVPGVWGPYFSSMVPGLWLSEGGQSASGALLDYVVRSHASLELTGNVYDALNARLDELSRSRAFPAELTRELHVLPDHHGNRSPRADATLRGMVSGLSLANSVDALAVLYLATVQAIAHGTKHILDTMNANGYAIDTIVACGGDTKNAVFLREHADITGRRIVLPREPEAVLLGSAILGATAAGDAPSVLEAMASMSHAGRILEPAGGAIARYHGAKHEVFQRMYSDQIAYRDLMRI